MGYGGVGEAGGEREERERERTQSALRAERTDEEVWEWLGYLKEVMRQMGMTGEEVEEVLPGYGELSGGQREMLVRDMEMVEEIFGVVEKSGEGKEKEEGEKAFDFGGDEEEEAFDFGGDDEEEEDNFDSGGDNDDADPDPQSERNRVEAGSSHADSLAKSPADLDERAPETGEGVNITFLQKVAEARRTHQKNGLRFPEDLGKWEELPAEKKQRVWDAIAFLEEQEEI
jgi:DNA-directed RNA polymerase subunit delta